MAVPVKGAKIILESVINTLIGKKYTSIKDEEDKQLKLF